MSCWNSPLHNFERRCLPWLPDLTSTSSWPPSYLEKLLLFAWEPVNTFEETRETRTWAKLCSRSQKRSHVQYPPPRRNIAWGLGEGSVGTSTFSSLTKSFWFTFVRKPAVCLAIKSLAARRKPTSCQELHKRKLFPNTQDDRVSHNFPVWFCPKLGVGLDTNTEDFLVNQIFMSQWHAIHAFVSGKFSPRLRALYVQKPSVKSLFLSDFNPWFRAHFLFKTDEIVRLVPLCTFRPKTEAERWSQKRHILERCCGDVTSDTPRFDASFWHDLLSEHRAVLQTRKETQLLRHSSRIPCILLQVIKMPPATKLRARCFHGNGSHGNRTMCNCTFFFISIRLSKACVGSQKMNTRSEDTAAKKTRIQICLKEKEIKAAPYQFGSSEN